MPSSIHIIDRNTSASFPEKPFEDIGFGLSGGGFRAAAYEISSVLSLLHGKITRWIREEPTLLRKVRTVSSASGSTITLAIYGGGA